MKKARREFLKMMGLASTFPMMSRTDQVAAASTCRCEYEYAFCGECDCEAQIVEAPVTPNREKGK